MEYEIVITKRELNPEFKPNRAHYGPEIEPYLRSQMMSVVLTEEEFRAIKKAVIETM